jgi:hypothetical protein
MFFVKPGFETKEACEQAYFKVLEGLAKYFSVKKLDLYSSFCISDCLEMPLFKLVHGS